MHALDYGELNIRECLYDLCSFVPLDRSRALAIYTLFLSIDFIYFLFRVRILSSMSGSGSASGFYQYPKTIGSVTYQFGFEPVW